MRLRRCGILLSGSFVISQLLTIIVPRVGIYSRMSKRNSVVLPAPEGPTRKTNSPLSMASEISVSPALPVPNTFETLSKTIIGISNEYQFQISNKPFVSFEIRNLLFEIYISLRPLLFQHP